MKPPPPMLPAVGWTTASANAGATAASTAVPPSLIASAPMREAISFCDATIPFFPRTGTQIAPAGRGHGPQTPATRERLNLAICAELYVFQFPPPSPEDHGAHHGHRRKGDGYCPEHAGRTHAEQFRQNVGDRNLAQPEAEHVDDRRRPRVAGAVERLRQH